VRADDPKVAFDAKPGRVEVSIAGEVVATYVDNDSKTLRPYFEHLKTPSGIQVTRTHPPVTGKDAIDHADMHPGLWLAFGDIAGNDFWRNNGPRVVHERFVENPTGGNGRGGFTVENRYVVGDQTLCRETTRYVFLTRPNGYAIIWNSTFTAERDSVWFGTQEEMGLGVRVATPITVKMGSGRITNSLGQTNEKGTWGHAAEWCDYSGTIDGRQVGVTLMADRAAERKPWFHSRDYGVLVANPTGPRAGAPDRVPLARGETLRMRFAVLVHEGTVDLAREYGALREFFH
jgi:hypothetical protein